MTRRILVAVLAALAALPATATATTRATVRRTVIDAAYAFGADDPARPRVLVSATVMRMTQSLDDVSARGPASAGADQHVLCLAYAAGSVREAGCVATTPGRAVTDGVLVPTGATIRARVPVSGRRGGWIEADLTLVNAGPLVYDPTVAHRRVHTRDVLGQDVPTGAWTATGAVVWCKATVTGSLRTDRGLRTAVAGALPSTLFPTSLLRWDVTTANAALDPDDVTAHARATTLAGVGG